MIAKFHCIKIENRKQGTVQKLCLTWIQPRHNFWHHILAQISPSLDVLMEASNTSKIAQVSQLCWTPAALHILVRELNWYLHWPTNTNGTSNLLVKRINKNLSWKTIHSYTTSKVKEKGKVSKHMCNSYYKNISTNF